MTDADGSRVSVGDPVLDGMLNGGLPENRAILVTGGPGTGKSTLAMQFLQEGLADGERCLYISTEQTIEEIQDSFGDFDFDLEHDELTFASIHATPGHTLEGGGEELTLQTFEDGEFLGEAFNAPFTGEYIQQYLDRYGPADRVVLDSASGLEAITDDPAVYRRTVLDLIRFFSDEFEATSVFTAEGTEDQNPGAAFVGDLLQFTTHGVIRLDRKTVNDDPHRYLEIRKMRGVDHDRRTAELEFTSDGIRVGPVRRSQPPELKDHAHRPIGIDGLDALCGGGLVEGAGVLLQHDGRATLNALLGSLLGFAFEHDYATVVVPTIELRQRRMATIAAAYDTSVETLLADDRLFVIDMMGAWDTEERNVFGPRDTSEALVELFGEIQDRTDRRRFSLFNADAIVHALGASGAREIRYYEESRLLDPEDMLVHVNNPDVVEDRMAAFYQNSAEQVLETKLQDDGLQYLTLRKSPCGFVGSTSLVEYTYEPPYIRVQDPPRERETPHSRE